MLLPIPPCTLQIPQTCHGWWILPPKWIHALHWPTADRPVRSPQPLPVTACITCREHWCSAASRQPRAPSWDWSLVWDSLCRKPSRHVQALQSIVLCNTICPVNTVDGSCALYQWDFINDLILVMAPTHFQSQLINSSITNGAKQLFVLKDRVTPGRMFSILSSFPLNTYLARVHTFPIPYWPGWEPRVAIQ